MTIGVELDNKRRSDGRFTLYISIFHKVLRRHNLSIRIEKKDWSHDQKRIKPSAKNAIVYNRTIGAVLAKAEALAAQPGATADSVQAGLRTEDATGKTFYDLAREHLKKSGSGFHQKNNTHYLIGTVERIRPGLRPRDFTKEVLVGIEQELLAGGNSRNTTTDKLQRLHDFWTKVAGELPDPWKGMKFKKEETKRRGLRPERFDVIVELDLSGMPYYVEVARDVIVAQYYLGGIRWGDLCRLTDEDIQHREVHYKTGKKSKVIRWPLHDVVLAIFEKYKDRGHRWDGKRFLMPFLRAEDMVSEERQKRRISSQLQAVNKGLKVIAALAGTPPLTSYWSRHSITIKAVLDNVPLRGMQNMLGHSDSRTTDVYGRSLNDTINQDTFEKMFKK